MNFHKVFKGATFVAAAAAVSLMVSACGSDDKDPASPEKVSEESSDSESDESSSSKGKVSSSSEAEEESSSSSAIEVPEGTRVATLEDLAKNISLGEMFGDSVYLATGNHKGLFSLWVPDTAWIVFDSKFENGVLSFDSSNSAALGLVGPEVVDSMQAFAHDGATLNFVVRTKDSTLLYSTDGETYKEAETVSVSKNSTKVSNSDDLEDKTLTCKNGDQTETYSFYDGRYYTEISEGDSLVSWSAGYYDVQRSTLFMLPKFFKGSVMVLDEYFVDPELTTLSFYGDVKKSCKSSTLKYDEVTSGDIAGSWVAVADKTVEWSFDLNEDGTYKVVAKESGSTKQSKSGKWDIYGDIMFLYAKTCLQKGCTQSVKGTVSGFDVKAGFEFSHSDTDTPEMPTSWTVPEVE